MPMMTRASANVSACLMGALRSDPGKDGSFYFARGGGIGTALGRGGLHRGHDVGAKLGYRRHIYDISLDAGINHDPMREVEEHNSTPWARHCKSRRRYDRSGCA